MKPVRPGDVLSARYTAQEKRDLASRPRGRPRQGDWSRCSNQGRDGGQPGAPTSYAASATGRSAARRHRREGARAPMRACGTCGGPARRPRRRNFFEDREIGELADFGAPYVRQGRDRRLCPRLRSPALPSRRGGGEGLAVRRPVCVGLAHGGHLHPRLGRLAPEDRCRQRRRRRQRRRFTVPRPGFKRCALAEARLRRRHHRVPHPTPRRSTSSRAPTAASCATIQGRNQHGEIVFAITGQILAERREPYNGA